MSSILNWLAVISPEAVMFPIISRLLLIWEPLIIRASLLNEPNLIVSSENTSKTGNPEISETANREPLNPSSIENNCPEGPTTSNIDPVVGDSEEPTFTTPLEVML